MDKGEANSKFQVSGGMAGRCMREGKIYSIIFTQ